MSKFRIRNDVRSELTQAIDSSQTTMRVAKAISPFRNIPSLDGGTLHLTLVDNLADVSKIEIVNVTAITDETSYWQLTVERGAEETSSYAFDAGAPVFLALTQEAYHEKQDADDLGTAAFEDITTSSTDTTSGRVTRVGDFGLGADISANDADLNTEVKTQFEWKLNSAPNSPSGNAGALINIRRGSGIAAQIFEEQGSDRFWFRRQIAAGWQPWLELYHSGNLNPVEVGDFGVGDVAVGPISQAAAAGETQFFRGQLGDWGVGNTVGINLARTGTRNFQLMGRTDHSAVQMFADAQDSNGNWIGPVSLWHSGSPQINSQHFRQTAIHSHGNTSGAKTIALADGNYQTLTLTGDSTFSFTAPPGPCSCNLLITNSGAGNTITLPASVVFETGFQPEGDGDRYVLTIIYDGSDYWASWTS